MRVVVYTVTPLTPGAVKTEAFEADEVIQTDGFLVVLCAHVTITFAPGYWLRYDKVVE